MRQLERERHPLQQTLSDTECVHSKEGNTFTTFYKSPKWGKFLYEDLVEPYFHSSFAWETWMNGINPLPSYCAPDYTYNVVNVRTLAIGGASWKETQDHSKWAVSQDGSTPIVCIGDINRQKSQAGRAGGVQRAARDARRALSESNSKP